MTSLHLPDVGQPLIDALGLALIHFVWQGAAIAVLLAIALTLMRRISARRRYAVCCIAMLAMIGTPAATLYFDWPSRAPSAPIAAIDQRPRHDSARVALNIQPASSQNPSIDES